MKRWQVVLLIVVVAVVLLVLFAYLRGGAVKTNEADIVINRPAADLWPYITRPDELRRWVEGYVDSVPVGGDTLREEQLEEGLRTRKIMEIDGRRYEMQAEVKEVIPGSLLVVEWWTEGGQGFTSRATYELVEDDTGTVFRMRQESEYSGFLPRVFAGAVTGRAQEKLETDLERLKRVAEDDATEVALPEGTDLEEVQE